jgi:hypothetical protein
MIVPPCRFSFLIVIIKVGKSCHHLTNEGRQAVPALCLLQLKREVCIDALMCVSCAIDTGATQHLSAVFKRRNFANEFVVNLVTLHKFIV